MINNEDYFNRLYERRRREAEAIRQQQQMQQNQQQQSSGPSLNFNMMDQFMGGGETAGAGTGTGTGGATAGTAGGGGGAGGATGMLSNPWVWLAAAIAGNEISQSKAGNRPESKGEWLKEALTGEVLERDMKRYFGDTGKVIGQLGNPEGTWELLKGLF